MQNNYHIKITNPILDHLGYIKVVANLEDKHDRSAPSHFHWKILKCRMIIFSHSSVLACPDKTDVKQVHIIFRKAGDDFDKLNSLFLKFSLAQDGAIMKVTPEMFRMCFHYTLTAKIAPVWNTLGYNYLINNRDFLTSVGPQEGIKCNISSTETVTEMEVKPVKIHLIHNNDNYLAGEWVRVLPSLNKATVEDSCDDLPESGSFKSYKDLRRHWKNIHGYRLPEVEGAYYRVQFWRGEPLTYPAVCVTRNFPIITPVPKPTEEGGRGLLLYGEMVATYPLKATIRNRLKDKVVKYRHISKKSVLSRYLACLRSKMPHILGTPLKMQIEYGESILQQQQQVNENVPDTQAVSLCTPTQNSR